MVAVKDLPPGAVKVHFGTVDTALFPRGSMQKESVGEYLLDRLRDLRHQWTNKSYGDSVSREDATKALAEALCAEVQEVIMAFEED